MRIYMARAQLPDPHAYYRYIGEQYADIAAVISQLPQQTITIDIDETVHCNTSDMPPEFAAFTTIPLAREFVDSIAHRHNVVFLTGRGTDSRARTLDDLRDFTYDDLVLHDTLEPVRSFKQRIIAGGIGIGDQWNDITDSEYKLYNPYYTIEPNGRYIHHFTR